MCRVRRSLGVTEGLRAERDARETERRALSGNRACVRPARAASDAPISRAWCQVWCVSTLVSSVYRSRGQWSHRPHTSVSGTREDMRVEIIYYSFFCFHHSGGTESETSRDCAPAPGPAPATRRPDDGRKVGHPRWTTSGVSSFARLKWAVNDMGATPTLAWCCALPPSVVMKCWCALCYIHYGLGVAWDVRVCSAAASGGHLAMLQWLHAQGCPWDEWACAYAAEYGQRPPRHAAVASLARLPVE